MSAEIQELNRQFMFERFVGDVFPAVYADRDTIRDDDQVVDKTLRLAEKLTEAVLKRGGDGEAG